MNEKTNLMLIEGEQLSNTTHILKQVDFQLH